MVHSQAFANNNQKVLDKIKENNIMNIHENKWMYLDTPLTYSFNITDEMVY
jgi:hypothetical protein